MLAYRRQSVLLSQVLKGWVQPCQRVLQELEQRQQPAEQVSLMGWLVPTISPFS